MGRGGAADEPMANTHLQFDLADEIAQLRREPDWSLGRKARTLISAGDVRTVLMVLRANAQIATHRAPGRISIQTLDGRIQVRAEGRTFSLPAGSLLTLERGIPHDVEAQADSAFLLTVVLSAGS